MATESKLFTVKLTDDERVRLEAHRVRLGLRAQTDVIRHWINADTSLAYGVAQHAAAADRVLSTVAQTAYREAQAAENERARRSVAADPVQKPGAAKATSRLKGEWKAP